MAQIRDQELSAQEVHQRFRGRRRTLHEAMPRPLLIHRPTPDERLLHGASGGYLEALSVLRRALEDGALMASLRRILTSGRAQVMSDLEILERLAREVAGGRMIIYGRPSTARPTDTRYAAATDRDYRALLAGPFAGSIPNMYLDSRGFVTVGIGKVLRTPADAVAIRFVRRGGMRQASAAEIAAAYLTVRGAVANRTATTYRNLTDLDLGPGESDRLLNQELQRAEDSCRTMFGGWEHSPLAAQLALLDMVYNLGGGRAITDAERQAGGSEQGLYQFHRLREAVAREDWIAASRECHRAGVQAGRDIWTRNKFLEAALIAPPRPEPHRALNL